MNTTYLDNLPEVNNKFIVDLDDGERVVFTAKMPLFGTASGRLLGSENSQFIMTNRRILAYNGIGMWSIDIADDIISYQEVNKRTFILKEHYYLIMI